jgi:hypothetical protein
MAFQIIRNGKECPQTWSAFNQALSKCDPDLTTVGYMPLIQAPAHDFDTLNTVAHPCMYISEKLGEYVGVVLRKGVRFRRIDVVFDRYRTVYKIRNTKKKIKIRTAN